MKKLMTGNEAVARGAYEAGVMFASGYPGTPATDILESLADYPPISTCWATNEKVAIEMASGASFGGKRAMVIMKHVGLNVASDPLMTLSYTGVRGGLVIVVSDDPGMHSSQNEQDSRLYSRMAKLPLLEPSDSNDALLLTKEAFMISEEFDTPVILRLTASISHTSSVVELGEMDYPKGMEIKSEPEKYVMLPPFCIQRRIEVEKRWLRLIEFSESSRFNRIEDGPFNEIGVLTSGISYQYVKEAMPHIPVLKLAITNPLPLNLIRRFSAMVKRLFVVEELEPFMEDAIRAEGIEVIGKRQGLPTHGELSTSAVRNFITNGKTQFTVHGSRFMDHDSRNCDNTLSEGGSFCPGCLYLGLFYCLQRLDCFVFGDIGCYTLGARVFPGSIDTTLCMGAGISQATGFLKVNRDRRAIAVIGDSTFFHSGIPGIINAVHHKIPITVIILNNRTTAMTGGQTYTGIDIDLKGLLRAMGVKRIIEIPPYDISLIMDTLEGSLSYDELSVIILKGECSVKAESRGLKLDETICNGCRKCIEIRCPAIRDRDGKISIEAGCTGCGLCASFCQMGAIG